MSYQHNSQVNIFPAGHPSNGNTTINTLNNNINLTMNATNQPVPTSINSIHAPPSTPMYITPTTTTSYNPTPSAPANPADLVQFPLKLAPNKKKSNIAKFYTPNFQPLDFNTMALPIKMHRAPELNEPEPPPPPKENPYFKKKTYVEKKPLPKDPKAIPLHIEDNEGNHSYDGIFEGAQTSHYALLVFENGVFNVIPVADWYNFKAKRNYQTFSTEEAEIMMSKRSELAKKLAEKHGQALAKAEEAAGGGAGGGGGGGGGGDKEDAEFQTTEEEDPDRFAAFGRADSDEDKKKKQQKQKNVKKEEGGDSDNGEEPDWEGVFDDDEDAGFGNIEDADTEQPSGREAGEAEGDGEDKDLTEAGKEIRNILKRQKEDDLSEAGSEFGSEEDDDDEDDEDDFNLEEKLPFINQLKTFNANAAAEPKQEDTSKNSDEARPSPLQAPETPVGGEKEKKKSPTGSSKKKGGSKGKSVKEETTPKGEKAKSRPSSSSKKTSGSKRGATEGGDIKSPPTTNKKAKVETPKSDTAKPSPSTAKPAAAVAGGPAVTEEEVRRILSQGKRLRTLDLVAHFKAALVDAKQKTKFTELTRKLCTIVEEGGVKYLMLK